MLSGWSGSGKDAVSSLLMDELGFQRFAFADPLKHEVARLSALPLNYFYAAKDNSIIHDGQTTTPRTLLIKHAAEAREKYPNIYANMVADSIQRSESDSGYCSDSCSCSDSGRVVVSDWRYRNESEVFDIVFGNAKIIRARVVRPGIVQSAEPSEHDLDDEPMDLIITNSGSLSDLRATVKAAIRPYLTGSLFHVGS
jgi:dephospho-CoA kinase